MRREYVIATIAYVEIAAAFAAMLASGGFAWYPWVPVGAAVTGAVFATVSASRSAGIAASAVSLAFATIGIAHQKYFGPLGFAAASALAIAATSLIAPRLARVLFLPLSFVEAAWIGSFIRQTVYEIRTSGHTTLTVDPCATALLPVSVAAFLLLAFAMSAGANTLASLDERVRPWNRLRERQALVFSIVAGAASGFALWRDWQIAQPCI